jgi:hypothetical protein
MGAAEVLPALESLLPLFFCHVCIQKIPSGYVISFLSTRCNIVKQLALGDDLRVGTQIGPVTDGCREAMRCGDLFPGSPWDLRRSSESYFITPTIPSPPVPP